MMSSWVAISALTVSTGSKFWKNSPWKISSGWAMASRAVSHESPAEHRAKAFTTMLPRDIESTYKLPSSRPLATSTARVNSFLNSSTSERPIPSRSPPSKEKVTSRPSISLVFQEAIWEASPVKDIGASCWRMEGRKEPLDSPFPSPSRVYSVGTYLAGAGANTTNRMTKNTPTPHVHKSFFLYLCQKLRGGAVAELGLGYCRLPKTGLLCSPESIPPPSPGWRPERGF